MITNYYSILNKDSILDVVTFEMIFVQFGCYDRIQMEVSLNFFNT